MGDTNNGIIISGGTIQAGQIVGGPNARGYQSGEPSSPRREFDRVDVERDDVEKSMEHGAHLRESEHPVISAKTVTAELLSGNPDQPTVMANTRGIAESVRAGAATTASAEIAKTAASGCLPAVFISYAWGDTSPCAATHIRERQEVVERMCAVLEKGGRRVIRDKTALQYGGLISEFMERLGRADLVVVVLSDAYLRSPYCMTELHALYQRCSREKHEFLGRIIPLVLDDARFRNPQERVEYTKFWKQEYSKLKADLEYLSTEDFRLYRNMEDWQNHVGDMLAYINDVLSPRGFDAIVKDDFAALRKMLQQASALADQSTT
jgi:hypothetical protein